MANKVIHPNFRIGPGQTNVGSRSRAIMYSVSQEVYDFMMAEVDAGHAKDLHQLISRALETRLGLPVGAIDPVPSERR